MSPTTTQAAILQQLASGPKSIHDLRAAIYIRRSSLRASCRLLMERGLITRTTDTKPGKGRPSHIYRLLP